MRTVKNQRVSIAARVAALAMVAVFSFHMSRFYLSIELCTHNTKDGSAMQHCKDVLGWLTAPRAQMDEVSAPSDEAVFEIVFVRVDWAAAPVADVAPAPPFHPPRFLS